MIYFEELKLHLIDAKMAYEELLSKPAEHWSDWYAQSMIKGGLQIESGELATLLREADVAYHAEPEQSSWLNYISSYIYNRLN